MGLSIKGRNTSANALAAAYPYISLHSATPSDAGSNETAAARIAAAWTAAATGQIEVTGPLAFTGGASNGAVAAFGWWSEAVGGDFGGYYPVTGDASFNSAGEYSLDTASATDNG